MSNEWKPSHVFDTDDGMLYAYYSGDGITLTPDMARALAGYLTEWASAKAVSE